MCLKKPLISKMRQTVTYSTNLLKVTTMLLVSSFLFACASSPTNPNKANANAAFNVSDGQTSDMLGNMLSVMPQLLEPQNTTLQVGPETLKDYRFAVQQLSLQGFGLQYVDADQGRLFLQIEPLSKQFEIDENIKSFRVSIGSIELTRTYRVLKRSYASARSAQQTDKRRISVVPISPLKLAGSRKNITIDDSAFEKKLDENSAVSRIEYASAAPIVGGIPTISLITDEIVDRVVAQSSNGPTVQALNSNKVEVTNLYYNAGSAFGSLYDNYDRIRRETVVFPDDSLRLGDRGKRRVSELLEDYVERSDVFSIVGCSNGPTKLAMGNEGLALGRAARIGDELVALGVAREKIFDEGCWGPNSTGDRFPGRGVVIDLWRRKS